MTYFGRRGDRDPMLWNFANDYVVNSDLIEGNVGERIRLVEILHDYKSVVGCPEEVYDDLYKQAEEEGRVFEQSTLDVRHGYGH